MAHISARIFAASLGHSTSIEVIIPNNPLAPKPVEKVLYLLHGLGQDCTAWGRYTNIEALAEKYNYAVIMPEVHRSFYANMVYGSDYFDYVAFELPKICEQLFQINHVREKTFAAGLSMGGYGALRCGLTRPEFYGACAGFSGSVEPQARVEALEQFGMGKQIVGILGQSLAYPDEANLYKLASKVAFLPEIEKPKVLITCGDKDYLLEDNRRLDAHMKKLSIPYKYMEWAGEHDFKFWQESLSVMFEYFEEIEGVY
ncbi:MAG: esterase family protein [Defluviitaleaceae bacterium]|nr:esterase family protein [Defluviitaleaceae bacterium]